MSSIVRWNPFSEIERFFPLPRDLFARFGEVSPETWQPRCDVTQGDGAIVIHAELPGVEAKDMDVSIQGNRLVIRGEKRSEKKEEKEGRTYSERFFGSFERAIPIPEGVDPEAIQAKLKDGVLEVRVPVPAAAVSEPKRIEIKAG
jgi:HSP20 family protein